MPSLDFIFKTCTGHDTTYWSERGDLDWYDKYADVSDAGKGVLTANWNHFPRNVDTRSMEYDGPEYQKYLKDKRRFEDILENAGYQLEWSDQTGRCEHCYGCIRTDAQCYGDTAHYAILNDCEMVCEDCIRKDFAAEYLEGMEDTPRAAVHVRGINPAKHGYVQIETGFENGFHPGQTDDPIKIARELESRGYSRLLFVIDDSGQFDIDFSVWCHSKGQPNMVQLQSVVECGANLAGRDNVLQQLRRS